MSTVHARHRAGACAIRFKVDGIPASRGDGPRHRRVGRQSDEELAAEEGTRVQEGRRPIVDPSAQAHGGRPRRKEKNGAGEERGREGEQIAETAEKRRGQEGSSKIFRGRQDPRATLATPLARAFDTCDTNKQGPWPAFAPRRQDSEALRLRTNRSLDDETPQSQTNRAWVRLYGVKVALVNNPKCRWAVDARLRTQRGVSRPGELKAIPRRGHRRKTCFTQNGNSMIFDRIGGDSGSPRKAVRHIVAGQGRRRGVGCWPRGSAQVGETPRPRRAWCAGGRSRPRR